MTRKIILFFLCSLLFIGTYCGTAIAATEAVEDEFYPRYHLAPPHGWMNDPNGFSVFNGEYHLFYQYNPKSSLEPGIAHWGHAKSADLFHWEHLPIAMYPDESYDKDGVFSGSALIENNTMYLFYTGNVNHQGETPDHEQRQALAWSKDGIDVVKYEGNPIIKADDLQPNIRDPKVWKHNDQYYMVLGNSFNNDSLGRVLLFKSENKIDWEEVATLAQSNGTLGYMFECPDFFELDGRFVLLFSPQGVKAQGYKYQNLYQTGYIVGNFDYETHKFTQITEFQELDHGHDFYATQTIRDDQGRRLLVAWMDMWEQVYPEREDGFTGQMTIIRELRLSDHNTLVQKPINEVKNIRCRTLYDGRDTEKVVHLQDKTGEINIVTDVSNLEVVIQAVNSTAKMTISYDVKAGVITLNRSGDDGIRRTEWKPSGRYINWRIFVDASSVELFCGKGEVTFSSRYFPESDVIVSIGDNTDARVKRFQVTSLKRSVTSRFVKPQE